jgi:hypothetical protein
MEENITSTLHGLLYLCVLACYMYLFIYNVFISRSLCTFISFTVNVFIIIIFYWYVWVISFKAMYM